MRRTFPPGIRNLTEASVHEDTCARYLKAVELFRSWAVSRGGLPTDPAELDKMVARYLDEWYLCGGGVAGANNLVYGLLFVDPHRVGSLRVSKRAIKGIKKLLPTKSWVPITLDLALLVAMWIAGCAALPPHHRDLGLAVLVQFAALLRTGEVLNLRVSDVLFAGDLRRGSETAFTTASLRLAFTKTGPNQFASVMDERITALLQAFVAGKPSSAKLFRASGSVYRRLFKRACKALGLRERYVPHSLRHGQATRLFGLGVSAESLLIMGDGRRSSPYVFTCGWATLFWPPPKPRSVLWSWALA
jgi:integrase